MKMEIKRENQILCLRVQAWQAKLMTLQKRLIINFVTSSQEKKNICKGLIRFHDKSKVTYYKGKVKARPVCVYKYECM